MMEPKEIVLIGIGVSAATMILSSLHSRFGESAVTGGSWSQLTFVLGLIVFLASALALITFAVQALWRLM